MRTDRQTDRQTDTFAFTKTETQFYKGRIALDEERCSQFDPLLFVMSWFDLVRVTRATSRGRHRRHLSLSVLLRESHNLHSMPIFAHLCHSY